MVYYLMEFESFDRNSPVRILLGICVFILLFASNMYFITRTNMGYLVPVILTFVFTYAIGKSLNNFLLPRRPADCTVTLSRDHVTVRRKGIEQRITNRDLVHGGESPDSSPTFTVKNETGSLEIPFVVERDLMRMQSQLPDKLLSFDVKDGVLILIGGWFRRKYYPL